MPLPGPSSAPPATSPRPICGRVFSPTYAGSTARRPDCSFAAGVCDTALAHHHVREATGQRVVADNWSLQAINELSLHGLVLDDNVGITPLTDPDKPITPLP